MKVSVGVSSDQAKTRTEKSEALSVQSTCSVFRIKPYSKIRALLLSYWNLNSAGCNGSLKAIYRYWWPAACYRFWRMLLYSVEGDLLRTAANSTMSAVFTYTDCCLPYHSTASPATSPSVAWCAALGGCKSPHHSKNDLKFLLASARIVRSNSTWMSPFEFLFTFYIFWSQDHSNYAVYGVKCLRLLKHWARWFESQ
jgi:hypothetical protein